MTTYSVPIEITPEPEGGFSVVCLTLPGCVSQGDTIDEAIENITEAFAGSVEGYKFHGMEIPWERAGLADMPIRKKLAIKVE